ncbi:MAG: hypothetical protein IMZ62_17275 [Chloroflexi bacterium]|nr:hypothetical protein [Chloroflexota bacterium]
MLKIGVCKRSREHQVHLYRVAIWPGDVGVATALCTGEDVDAWTRLPDDAFDVPPKGYRRCERCAKRKERP